ncbi:MAG: GntR family transcriptional regulator [Alphaproteobacteria bacterium]
MIQPLPNGDAGRSLEDASAEPRRGSQTDAAYARLKDMIVSGEIDPADHVDAKTLADLLALGRTPVREALLRLQTEGIVRIVPKRGVRIVTLSADDITEIYQVISAIEIEAVRILTLARPSSRDLDQLSDGCERMTVAAKIDDREAWILADEAFHRTLLALNPNRRLRDVGLLHRDLAQRAHFVALRLLDRDQLAKSARRHKKLVKLIVAGDVEAAVLEHHVQRERGQAMLVGILTKYRLTHL